MELDRCLSSFSSPEILEAGNEWYCPKCKDHKLAQKQLNIYRAPKILILHLKRFKQKGTFKKEKNESLIHFPQALDLSPYVIDKKPVETYKEEIEEPIYINPKAEDLPLIVTSTSSAPTYELYAISNHFGGLGGGHYTAYAKNQGEWYEFDDSRVGSTRKKEIVSSSAYILFYERK
jgi:ubiquitin carboxyl-terminal hydrolase 4/11/15